MRFPLPALPACFALFLVGLVAFAPLPAHAQIPGLGGSGGGSAEETSEAESGSGEETSAQTLIRILEDEQAREALIERLRTQANESEAAQEEAAQPSLARQIAEYTRDAAEQTSALVEGAGAMLAELAQIFAGTAQLDLPRLLDAAVGVLLVVAVAFVVFWALSFPAQRIFLAMAKTGQEAGIVRRALLLVGSSLIDALFVGVAWGVGTIVALQFGATGQMGINQSLFLNAFLFIELLKMAVRAVLAPRHTSLRLVSLGDTDAAYWYFWTSRLISLLGYTFLFIAPIVAANASPAAAEAIRILIAFTATMMGIAIVLQNRDRVRAGLARRAEAGRGDSLSKLLAAIGRYWHILAVVYVVALFVAWLTHPLRALPFLLWASAQSVIAVVLAVLALGLIARLIAGGVRLPQDVKERMPLLEHRLNAFVPTVLKVVRAVVLVVLIIALAQIWSLLDALAWLSSEAGRAVTGSLVSAGLIVAVGGLIYIAVSSWIEYRLNPNVGRVPTARERTLLSLLRNAFTVALIILVVMLALSQLGVNIGPLLAGAGVLGLAIGFGAQKLVQDIITGAFIQFENVMNEGDVVQVAGISGVVEKLTVRSVSIRELNGTYHLIPFSSVDAVSNFMKNFSYHVAEIGVAYREDIGEVKQVMQEAFDELSQTDHGANIISPMEMHGVTAFADSAVMVRARIKTVPGTQWALGRAYNEIVKRLFDERGIEIPFPHMTLYMGQDKQGRTTPLPIVDAKANPNWTRVDGHPMAAARKAEKHADETANFEQPKQDAPNEGPDER